MIKEPNKTQYIWAKAIYNYGDLSKHMHIQMRCADVIYT